MGTIRIGISGWRYAPWRGSFYPQGLRQADELAFAARHFGSIEINGTFYGLQRPASFAAWAAEVPEDFVFAVKAPRFITHMLRLERAEVPLANFLASGLLALGAKLGPILWQLPPSFAFDRPRVEAFLDLLPHDVPSACRLARRHDAKVEGRALVEADGAGPLRHALEIRHPSFVVPDFAVLLRRHGVAAVCADTPRWPRLMEPTADFAYCRLHGAEELYASGYDDASLDAWAAQVRAWAQGGDVYVYFDNDVKIRAPFDAQALMAKLTPPASS